VYFQTALQINPDMQAAHVALGQLQGQNTLAPGVWGSPASPEFNPDATVPMTPVIVPQQPQVGPQLEYPATANSPELGTSSYMPRMQGARVGALPVYQQQVRPYQAAPVRR
jgi:hypothetical protein